MPPSVSFVMLALLLDLYCYYNYDQILLSRHLRDSFTLTGPTRSCLQFSCVSTAKVILKQKYNPIEEHN